MNMKMIDTMEEEEDDFSESFKATVEYQKTADEVKAAKKGAIWAFQMPAEPNAPGGKRITTVRFLLSFNKGTKYHKHLKKVYDKEKNESKVEWTILCPAEFESIGGDTFECNVCKKICTKHKLERKEFVKNGKTIAQYGSPEEWDGIETEVWNIWPVWDYRMYEDNPVMVKGVPGKPGVKLFAYKYNSASPLEKIYNINLKRYELPLSRGKTPLDLTGYDLEIQQIGENRQRTFDAIEPDPGYHEFEHADAIKDMDFSKFNLKWNFAMNNTKRDNATWLETLRKLKQGVEGGAPATAPVASKKRAAKSEPVSYDGDKYELVEE